MHVSLLPFTNGRQSNTLVVGWAPRLTYRSASPDPPLVVKTSVSFPAGTSRTQNCWDPVAPEMLVTGTPSVSTETPLPAVTVTDAFAECCTVPDVPVTVKVVVDVAAVDATVRVNVELPPAVTVAGEKLPVTSVGSPEMLSAIDCVLPFSGDVDTAYVPLAPCAIAWEAGETPTEKSGGSVALTVIDAVAECVVVEVPVTVKVVAGAAAEVVTVSVELPPAVTLAGENEPEAPAGRPGDGERDRLRAAVQRSRRDGVGGAVAGDHGLAPGRHSKREIRRTRDAARRKLEGRDACPPVERPVRRDVLGRKPEGAVVRRIDRQRRVVAPA